MGTKLVSMDDCSLNMTPMIDIVFQLILFFLFSLKFHDVQYRFNAELPKQEGLEPTQDPADLRPRLEVSLFRLDETEPAKARTKIKFAGAEWFVSSNATYEEREKTFAALRERIARVSKETSIVEGEIKTPLPTGSAVPHADVMKVLDVFWELKLLDVKFFGAPPPISRLHAH